MKKKIFAIVICVLMVVTAVCASGCSGCFSDTTTTGTKYTFSLIGNIDSDYDGENDSFTYELACWNAITEKAKNHNLTESEKWYYKYYATEDITVKEGENYISLYESAVSKQLELAISSKSKERATIVIPGERYMSAYAQLKDKLAETNTMLVGVSKASEFSKQGSLATQTCAIVIDYAVQGYMAGYTAVSAGYTKLGFVGYEDNMTKSMLMGYLAGAEKCAEEKGLTDGSVIVKYEYVINAENSNDTENMIKDMYSTCDIIMPETVGLEQKLADNAGEKTFVSVSGKCADKAAFSYAVDYAKLTEEVKKKVELANISSEVTELSSDIFLYKCKDNFEFSKADGEELILNTKSVEYPQTVTDVLTLVETLKKVNAEKLSK